MYASDFLWKHFRFFNQLYKKIAIDSYVYMVPLSCTDLNQTSNACCCNSAWPSTEFSIVIIFLFFSFESYSETNNRIRKTIIFMHIAKSKPSVTLLYLSRVNDMSCVFLHHMSDIFIRIFREKSHSFNSPLRYPLEVKNRYWINLSDYYHYESTNTGPTNRLRAGIFSAISRENHSFGWVQMEDRTKLSPNRPHYVEVVL